MKFKILFLIIFIIVINGTYILYEHQNQEDHYFKLVSVEGAEKELVPEGHVLFEYQTDMISYTYCVDDKIENEDIDISLTDQDVKKHLNYYFIHMFKENNTCVIIEVRLNEPKTETEYIYLIENGLNIDFDVKIK